MVLMVMHGGCDEGVDVGGDASVSCCVLSAMTCLFLLIHLC